METIDVGQISLKNTCFFEFFFEKACGVQEKALPLHSLHSKNVMHQERVLWKFDTDRSSTRESFDHQPTGFWLKNGYERPVMKMTQVNPYWKRHSGDSDRQNKPLALSGENLRSEYFERNIKIFYNGEFDPGSG